MADGVALRARTFEIALRPEPEGHWSATSSQVPGLHVEADTASEAEEEAREWAPQLLIDNGVVGPDDEVVLTFSRSHANPS